MSRRWFELLMDDHETAERVIAAMEKAFGQAAGPDPATIAAGVEFFAGYVEPCHNQKEEQHLFPLIESLGIPREGGPLAVMLHEHDEQKGTLLPEFKRLGEAYAAGDKSVLPQLKRAFSSYTGLLKDHFWKENDILYPMAARLMSPEDEQQILDGIAAREAALGPGGRDRYYELARQVIEGSALKDLAFGVDRNVLAAMLNTLPIEISFVDAEDTVRYFSHEGKDKIFPRTRGAIGTNVRNCHPQKSLHKVEQILADFKAGARDVAEFWIDFRGMKVHIRYFAVRDPKGTYLGTLETVQDVTAIQKLEGQKTLME
jgi:DUF438 domain-containing protein